jgi:hypothetical protein
MTPPSLANGWTGTRLKNDAFASAADLVTQISRASWHNSIFIRSRFLGADKARDQL